MARIAGGPKSITANLNMREWAQQADLYDQIRNENLWNKTLQISAVLEQSHPFSAVRVREVLKWSGSQQYRNLTLTNHTIGTGMKCPQCGSVVDPEWRFCQSCGAKLK
jgi:hypothetical protein